MKLEGIDKGNSFDWGKTSRDYAKYRDIYPEEFYKAIDGTLLAGELPAKQLKTVQEWLN